MPLATGFPVTLVFNVVFGAVLLGVDLARRGALAPVDAAGFGAFAVAGLCSTFLARYFFYGCVATLGAARASLFQLASPLVTALLGFAFLGERLAWPVVGAMVAVIVGLAIAGTSRRDLAGPPTGKADAGIAMGIGASIGYAVGNVLRGFAVGRWDEAIAGTLVGSVAALALQAVLTAASRDGIGPIVRASRRGLALYALLGVTTVTAQAMTVAAMARAPVALVALITLSTPMLVLPFSMTVLRHEERVGLRTLAGAALALGGMAVIVLR